MIIYDIMVKVSLMGKNKAHEPEVLNLNYTFSMDSATKVTAGEIIPVGNNGMIDFEKKIADYDGRRYKILNANSALRQIKEDIPKMDGIKALLEDLVKDEEKPETIEVDPENAGTFEVTE